MSILFAVQAKEAEVSKDMEALRSSEPDSPVFKILEQVSCQWHRHIYLYIFSSVVFSEYPTTYFVTDLLPLGYFFFFWDTILVPIHSNPRLALMLYSSRALNTAKHKERWLTAGYHDYEDALIP